MERNWTYRGTIYKTCLVLLIFGLFPFLIGFGAPSWLFLHTKENNGTVKERSFGLWEWCDKNNCFRNPSVGNEVVDDWFLVVVILQTLALLVYLVSLVMIIVQNFAQIRWIRTLRVEKLRDHLHRDSETPEDLGFVSGFLSLSGIILFMLMTAEVVSHDSYYSWGFAMAFTGASIQVITGMLMCKAHGPPQVAPPPQAQPLVVHTLNPERQTRRPEASGGARQPDRHRRRIQDRSL